MQSSVRPACTDHAGADSRHAQAFLQMYRIVDDLRTTLRQRDEALDVIRKAHNETLHLLALAAEYRDGDTGVHVVRVGALSEVLARACGMDRAYRGDLRQAAPMHDIGKIATPDHILKKRGALSAGEWSIMRQHAAIGAAILGGGEAPLFKLAAEIALNHHEQFDGSGYPHALRGAAIPLSGRIVALVDVYDALTMDRCYREAFADDAAIAMIERRVGAHFDPFVFERFLGVRAEMAEVRDYVTRNAISLGELADLPLS